MLNTTTYEALPFAYIGAGLLNAALLESPIKILPALLLIGAGLLVLVWRRHARAQARRRVVVRSLQARRSMNRSSQDRRVGGLRA